MKPGCKYHERQTQRVGRKVEERVLHGLCRRGIVEPQNHGGLTEVVDQQARHYEAEPGKPHRTAPEVAHVRIERLCAGHGQHDRTKREEAQHLVGEEELDRVPRIECHQHAGHLHQMVDAENGKRDKVDDHHRRE
jgi:hypothetical protein